MICSSVNRLDGLKLIFDNGEWILMRPSGTEPLIRIMAEGDDEKLVGQLVREIAGAVKQAAA